MNPPVDIRTQRLRIREFASADAPALMGITSDPEVVRYLSFGPTSPAEAAALLDFARMSAAAESRAEFVLAIDDAQSGETIGSCGLHQDVESVHERELFFVLQRDVWGRGLAGEAVGALIEYGFRELGLLRIYGVAHPENAASMRVMERVGMAYDGEVPDAFEDEHGWRAGRRYAILAPAT